MTWVTDPGHRLAVTAAWLEAHHHEVGQDPEVVVAHPMLYTFHDGPDEEIAVRPLVVPPALWFSMDPDEVMAQVARVCSTAVAAASVLGPGGAAPWAVALWIETVTTRVHGTVADAQAVADAGVAGRPDAVDASTVTALAVNGDAVFWSRDGVDHPQLRCPSIHPAVDSLAAILLALGAHRN